MKSSTRKKAAAPGRGKRPEGKAEAAPAAVHYVPAEMFDVTKVVRGEGVCEVACAAIEKRFSTSAKKHFFGLRTPVPFAVEIPVGGDAAAFEASCGIDAAGAPGYRLSGKAAEGCRGALLSLSITHEDDMAAAVCVLLRLNREENP